MQVEKVNMPFRSIEQDGVLTSADLDVLQDVYDAAAADVSNIDDITMQDVASTLIIHYRAGERDRKKLIALAIGHLQRTTG
jgi:hypothetical protein